MKRASRTFGRLIFVGLKKNKWALVFLVALTLFVYLKALSNGFVSDDINGITNNRQLQSWTTLRSYPFSFMQSLIYISLFHWFRLSPAAFHASNIVFHVFTVLTVFGIGSFFFSKRPALAAGLLFAVHPLLSEAVAWISAGAYGRYAFFFLLSFLLYLLYKRHRFRRLYWLSIAGYFLSLVSSDRAPVLFLIFIVFEWSQKHLKKSWKTLFPYLTLGLFFLLLQIILLPARFGAITPEIGSQSRFLNPALSLPFSLGAYLRLFFWPDSLALFHTEYFTDPVLAPAYFFLTALYAFSLFVSFFKNRRLFFFLVFFLLPLLPVLMPLRIASLIAERYAYLSVAALCLTVSLVFDSLSDHKYLGKITAAFLIIILPILSVRTALRIKDWQNDLKLGLSSLRSPSENAVKYENGGDALVQTGNFVAAAAEFKKAIALRPDYASLYNSLGYSQAHIGQYEEAMRNYDAALVLNPKLWQAYDNKAAVYTVSKDYQTALRMLRQAFLLAPQNNDLLIHFGIVYLQMGDKKNAKTTFEKALSFDPDNTDARNGLRESSH
ncbi:tetratricopeptide repeat protein [Candidatus Roizmanbacteria bacterium]|nr:tetratricopeptide repeat protein [Candidatus Roizmanbacteria bacterium]